MTENDLNLPWTIKTHGYVTRVYEFGSLQEIISDDSDLFPFSPSPEQMELIVRACNNYKNLIKAAEIGLASIKSQKNSDTSQRDFVESVLEAVKNN